MLGWSWQGCALGDPLYRPLTRSFAEQWAARETLAPMERVYLVLREVRRLENTQRTDEATTLAEEELTRTEAVPLRLAYAELLRQSGDLAKAREALAPLADEASKLDDGWITDAQTLAEAVGAQDLALLLAAVSLARPGANDVKIERLRPAVRLAKALNDPRYDTWERELATLTAPPTPTAVAPAK
jgi:predicted Zn-dependent protease